MGQCCGMEARVTMKELNVSAHGRHSNTGIETKKRADKTEGSAKENHYLEESDLAIPRVDVMSLSGDGQPEEEEKTVFQATTIADINKEVDQPNARLQSAAGKINQ